MTAQTRIEPIDDWIELTVNETLSPDARSMAVARFARDRIDEAEQANQRILGRIPPSKTFVDGREGAALEEVNPDRGTIAVEFELFDDVLRFIGEELVKRSPVTSGAYRDGHTLFADGNEVEPGGRIPAAQEYSFTNMVPYARKIEIGTTRAGRSFVIQVEPRIYERTARDARAKFGNVAKIEFTFRGIVGGHQIAAGSRGTAHNRSDVRYPTIVVTPR